MSTPSTNTTGSAENHHFKLRVELFQYERTSLEAHIEHAIQKIQRNKIDYKPKPFKMLPSHNILEFELQEQTNINAFDHFTLDVKLMQQSIPPCLYFTAVFMDAPKFFPDSTYLNGVYHRGLPSTFLKLDTDDGYLKIPPISTFSTENDKILANFKLSILLENLSFSTAPFEEYSPVDIKNGNLYFPVVSNIGKIPQIQTQLSHHHSAFNIPPPPINRTPINPPRLFRRGNHELDESIHWIEERQSYVMENVPKSQPSHQQQQIIEEMKQRTAQEAQARTVVPMPQSKKVQFTTSQALQTVPTPSTSIATETPSQHTLANLNLTQSKSLSGTAQSPQYQASAISLPMNVTQTEIPSQTQQLETPTRFVPESNTSLLTDPQSRSVPPSPALLSNEGTPPPQVNFSHITEEELNSMADTTDQTAMFCNQQQNHWNTFTNVTNAHIPKPLASSEPKYPNLPQNPNTLYGPRPKESYTKEQLEGFVSDFVAHSLSATSQVESGASTLVAPTIPYLPSINTTTTVPATTPEAGNTNSGQAAKVTVVSDKPKEPTSGFVNTIIKKTTRNKERSKSDEPK